MNSQSATVQRNYVILMLLNTLAASFIWGINTLFLLDAGLNNTQAFAANAFWTIGMVVFEIPTGVIADTWGRRISYLIGSAVLAASTLLYLLLWQISAPFLAWAAVSMLLGLGFSFFSGAVEAWLVDAMRATGFKGQLDSVFAKGQIASGVAMLTGSIAGGVIAQSTNLGVPYMVRAGVLVISFIAALLLMKDIGFSPIKGKRPGSEIRRIMNSSIEHGLKNRPVRWLMLAGPFTSGAMVYAFYAMQPYLLELYGDSEAYAVAGLAAAVIAGAQIVGGLTVPHVRRLFKKRTSLLIFTTLCSIVLLFLIGLFANFWAVLLLLIIWALLLAASQPVRQAYLNDMIIAKERATVLSFNSLFASIGDTFAQPALGKVADVWSYGTSYAVTSVVQIAALPFLALSRKENNVADMIKTSLNQMEKPAEVTIPKDDI